MITDEQLDRLPKYARDEIDTLRRELASREARILELTAGPENCDTVADPYAALQNEERKPFPLGNGATVAYRLGEHPRDAVHAHIIDRGQGRVLEIDGPGGVRGCLSVRPVSSNSLHIVLDARDYH